jgi:competence protein ComFC
MMQSQTVFRSRFAHRINWLQSVLLDFVFPPQCVACRAYGALLCASCAQRVQPVGLTICECCGRPQPTTVVQCTQCRQQLRLSIRSLRIAALHTSPLREAIHAFKYGQQPELAAPLARYLVATIQASTWQSTLHRIEGVVPVPLSRERREERGYNQAELLASAFCYSVQLPLCSAWLVRQRATQSQVGLNAVERQHNVAGAFVAARAVTGKELLLIDDVYTTGATMQACAEALLNAGATAVYGLALACPR